LKFYIDNERRSELKFTVKHSAVADDN